MKRTWLLALVALSTTAGVASAALRRVPEQYPTIQAAMSASVAGDIVQVGPGVYNDVTHPCSASDTTKTVAIMRSGVILRGAGQNVSVIDALGLGRGIYCEGVAGATIEGFTVRNAFAATFGAGIYAYLGCASSLVIRDCAIQQNLDGGIIVREGSSPTIQFCRITDNAGKNGGGLMVEGNCHPVVTSCLFYRNQAPSGGAIDVRTGSSLQISDSIINNNFINLAAGSGGAFMATASTLTVNNCLIQGNRSSGAGGGFYLTETTAVITNTQIVGNKTSHSSNASGGGLMVEFLSDVTLEDCLVARDSVMATDEFSDGGGIRASFAARLVLRRCTVAQNHAAGGVGGGVSLYTLDVMNATIEKCIIAFSSAGRGLRCDDQGGLMNLVVSCTDIFGNAGGNALCGTDGGNNFSMNPLFCDAASGNYYLQAASPCLPGQHPNGAGVCNGSRLGCYGGGCAPLDAAEAGATAGLALSNVPNPLQRATEIRFVLPRAARATVRLFDPAGREVRSLVDGLLPAGPHVERWDGTDARGLAVPSGVYFYQVTVDGRKETRRLVVAR